MFTHGINHGLLRAETFASGAQNTPEETRQAAEQFEALFIQDLLKQVRASSEDELFGSSRMTMVHEMFDAEVARGMAQAGGLGLADMLVRQLGHGRGVSAGVAAAREIEQGTVASGPRMIETVALDTVEVPRGPRFDSPAKFVETMLPLARKAAERLNVPAEAIVAQSALETGWGRYTLDRPDGRSAWNMFGIKAGGPWQGDQVAAVTIEVRDGVAQREAADFRAYGSLAESIEDYVDFLTGNVRYAGVLNQPDARSFGRALQEAGYATDPEYAAKVERIAREIQGNSISGPAQENENLADA